MPKRYQTLENGKDKLVEASDSSAGAANAGDIVALNASGVIDPSMLPAGEEKVLTAGEAIAAGDVVGINGSGQVVKADYSTPIEAVGFAEAGIANGATGNIRFEGIVPLTGLTPGARYYLDTTGSVTATPQDPTAASAGEIHQYVGTAISATELRFEADDCLVML